MSATSVRYPSPLEEDADHISIWYCSEMSFVPLITGEQQNDGEVHSISDMERPVQNVLGGMRVQRMSLVQSLRQYAFVYRGELQAISSCA